MHLDGGEADHLSVFLSEYEDGKGDDVGVADHIVARSLETGLEAAILEAVSGIDEEVVDKARRDLAPMPAHVKHACSLIGPRGVSPHVCRAIAPLLLDVDMGAEEGPFPGAALVWWEDGFSVWTPEVAGGTSAGIQLDGSILLTTDLPESVLKSLPGRPLSDLIVHPMIADGLVVRRVGRNMGRLELGVVAS